MNYEWYPGHMTAAIRSMREDLKLIDLVIELADARIPAASRNPDIDELCRGKARLLIYGKADLADPAMLAEWIRYQRAGGITAISADVRSAGALKTIRAAIDEASAPLRIRNEKRGLKNQAVRALVAGIPNVGKSTFINLLAGRKAAKTGNKPGVTRGRQWIATGKGLQLLDSPGILWPRIGDPDTGELLAVIGSMNDENLDPEALARAILARLDRIAPEAVMTRFSLPEEARAVPPEEKLSLIAEKRGFLGEGGRLLTSRAAEVLIDEFRKGRLGGFVLEPVPDNT